MSADITTEERCVSMEAEIRILRDQLAALQSVPQGVEVPELTMPDSLVSACLEELADMDNLTGYMEENLLRRGFAEGVSAARLVPTPPQAAPGAVIKIPEPTGISFFADGRDSERRRRDVLQGIQWARLNARIVYPATCKDSLQVPHSLQPEERRVGPDEVVVGRRRIGFLEDAANQKCASCRTIHTCTSSMKPVGCGAWKLDYARMDALRTSAQDHNETEKEI